MSINAAPDLARNPTNASYRYVRRGGPLGTFLVVCFALSIAAIFSSLSIFVNPPAGIDPDTLLALRATVLLRPACLIAIWFWSRLGVICFVALAAVSTVVVSVNGLWGTLFGIVSPAILLLFLRERWQFMRWGLSLRSRRVRDEELDS